MDLGIQIVEKPDWISWDDIKQCLVDAHADNRAKGINMSHYQWPSERIKDSLGERGFMLVALDGDKLIGTAAIGDKSSSYWYIAGKYAYVCFDGVIPRYRGRGIFRLLDSKREENAQKRGFDVLVFDTHEKNVHRQKIALKNGYRYVRFFRAKGGDHYSVVMVKWLKSCPYSKLYCIWKFQLSKIKTLLLTKLFRR